MQSGVPMKKSVKLKEGATKKSPTSKSHANRASDNIIIATDQVYQIALKSIISSIVPHCPKEILVEISKFINTIYPKLKDPCLNTIMENDTVKRRYSRMYSKMKVNRHDFPLQESINFCRASRELISLSSKSFVVLNPASMMSLQVIE